MLALATIALSAQASAQLKIGFMNSDRVLQEYKPFQEIEGEYKRFVSQMEKEFAMKENEFKSLVDKLQTQNAILSDVAKAGMQRDIESKRSELEQFVQEVNSPGGRIERKNAELSEPIFKEVDAVLRRVAKSEGYDFVFNSKGIAYAKEEHDITQKVLDELNKELEAKKKGSPAKSGQPGN